MAEVNIANAIKDQSDGAASERGLQKQWARKLADAHKRLAQAGGEPGLLHASPHIGVIITRLCSRAC